MLVVDQFEKLLGFDGDEVIEPALSMLEKFQQETNTLVVLGIRGDFFHQAAKYPWLLTGLRNNQEIIEPPTVANIVQVITKPAAQVNLDIAPDLLTHLVAEFSDHLGGRHATGALPLLSHLLFRMAGEMANGTMTIEVYEELGGIDRALEVSAETAFDALSPADKELSRELFGQLVELDDDLVPTRRAVNIADLEAEHNGEIDLESVLSAFSENRILVADVDSVRISHEALLTAWPRLTHWVDEERDSLTAARRVRVSANVWIESHEDSDTLLAGAQLERAIELLASPAGRGHLDDDSRRFVEQSQQEHDRAESRERRRHRVLASLVGVATVLALVSAGLAVRASNDSDRADSATSDALSRKFALQSSVLATTDSSLSKQVALVAYETSSTLEARSALLDASAGAPSARYLGAPGSTALAVSADGTRVVYSNAVDGSITVLENAGGGELQRSMLLELPDTEVDVYALALSADGRYLVSGGTDFYVSMWDLEGDAEPQQLDDSLTVFSGAIQALVIDPTTETVYGSGTGEGIGIWGGDDPLTKSQLVPATESVMGLAIYSEGSLLAGADMDGTVRLWNLDDTSEPIWSDESESVTIANTVAISPDGSLLAAGYRDSTVRLWDISNTAEIVELESPTVEPFGSWVNSVRFSPDGQTLAAASADGSIRFWSTSTWVATATTSLPTVITNLVFLSSSDVIVALADGSLRSIDLADMGMTSLGASIWAVDYSADGELLVAASANHATIWENAVTSPSIMRSDVYSPDEENGLTGTVAISPDGELLVLGSRTGDVFLVKSADPEDAQILEGLTALVENVAFSDDGSLIGAVDDGAQAKIWSIDSSGMAADVGVMTISGLAMNLTFDPESELIAVASDSGVVSLYELSGDQPPVLISEVTTGDSLAFGLAFHPTEPTLATGNGDGTIMFWDVSSPENPIQLGSVTGPNSRIFAIDFDGEGDHLAAAVGDDTAWIWNASDPSSPSLAAVLTAPEAGLYAVSFSPDSQFLVGAGADQRVYRWSLDGDEARSRICTTVGDSITEEEWADLLSPLPYAPPCGQ